MSQSLEAHLRGEIDAYRNDLAVEQRKRLAAEARVRLIVSKIDAWAEDTKPGTAPDVLLGIGAIAKQTD